MTKEEELYTSIGQQLKNAEQSQMFGKPCFKINGNAENFVLQLKKEGYQSEKFAKLGSFHYVSFSSFDKKPPALLEMKKIRAEGKYQTWLIYY